MNTQIKSFFKHHIPGFIFKYLDDITVKDVIESSNTVADSVLTAVSIIALTQGKFDLSVIEPKHKRFSQYSQTDQLILAKVMRRATPDYLNQLIVLFGCEEWSVNDLCVIEALDYVFTYSSDFDLMDECIDCPLVKSDNWYLFLTEPVDCESLLTLSSTYYELSGENYYG